MSIRSLTNDVTPKEKKGAHTAQARKDADELLASDSKGAFLDIPEGMKPEVVAAKYRSALRLTHPTIGVMMDGTNVLIFKRPEGITQDEAESTEAELDDNQPTLPETAEKPTKATK